MNFSWKKTRYLKAGELRVDSFGVFLLAFDNGGLTGGVVFEWAWLNFRSDLGRYARELHFPSFSVFNWQ